MSDEYQAFCQRKAIDFAELEAELEAMYPTEPPQQQQADTLTDAEYVRLAARQIEAALADFKENYLADFIAEVLVLERAEMDARVEQKLGALRAEVEILRSIVKSANVEQLVRKANVA